MLGSRTKQVNTYGKRKSRIVTVSESHSSLFSPGSDPQDDVPPTAPPKIRIQPHQDKGGPLDGDELDEKEYYATGKHRTTAAPSPRIIKIHRAKSSKSTAVFASPIKKKLKPSAKATRDDAQIDALPEQLPVYALQLKRAKSKRDVAPEPATPPRKPLAQHPVNIPPPQATSGGRLKGQMKGKATQALPRSNLFSGSLVTTDIVLMDAQGEQIKHERRVAKAKANAIANVEKAKAKLSIPSTTKTTIQAEEKVARRESRHAKTPYRDEIIPTSEADDIPAIPLDEEEDKEETEEEIKIIPVRRVGKQPLRIEEDSSSASELEIIEDPLSVKRKHAKAPKSKPQSTLPSSSSASGASGKKVEVLVPPAPYRIVKPKPSVRATRAPSPPAQISTKIQIHTKPVPRSSTEPVLQLEPFQLPVNRTYRPPPLNFKSDFQLQPNHIPQPNFQSDFQARPQKSSVPQPQPRTAPKPQPQQPPPVHTPPTTNLPSPPPRANNRQLTPIKNRLAHPNPHRTKFSISPGGYVRTRLAGNVSSDMEGLDDSDEGSELDIDKELEELGLGVGGLGIAYDADHPHGAAGRDAGRRRGNGALVEEDAYKAPEYLRGLLEECSQERPFEFSAFIETFPLDEVVRSNWDEDIVAEEDSLGSEREKDECEDGPALRRENNSNWGGYRATGVTATATGRSSDAAKRRKTDALKAKRVRHRRRHLQFKKIGEASYSEVFGIGDVVLKVIPLRDESRDQQRRQQQNDKRKVEGQAKKPCGRPKKSIASRAVVSDSDNDRMDDFDGPAPSDAKDVRKEIIVTRAMGDVCDGFVRLLKSYVVRGKYPDVFLRLWDEYNERKGSESVRPDTFTPSQLYCIIVLPNGGPDLETYTFTTATAPASKSTPAAKPASGTGTGTGWRQAASLFWQVAKALSDAEQLVSFEHRDLHWGQILVKDVPLPSQTATPTKGGARGAVMYLNDSTAYGVRATLIDLGLGRMDAGDGDGGEEVQWTPFEEEVFMGEGDYQYDVYRMMREYNGSNWEEFNPITNTMWLHYLSHKLLHSKNLRPPAAAATTASPRKQPHLLPISSSRPSHPSHSHPTASPADPFCPLHFTEKQSYDSLLDTERYLRRYVAALRTALTALSLPAAANGANAATKSAAVAKRAMKARNGEVKRAELGLEERLGRKRCFTCAGDVVAFGVRRGWVGGP